MNKQNTEQLKKELKEKYLEYYRGILSDEQIEASWQWTYNFFLPHLISSDEIKREAVERFYKWFTSGVNAEEYEWNKGRDEYEEYLDTLTQSKEGGE